MIVCGEYITVFDNKRGCYMREHDKIWLDSNGYYDLNGISEYLDGSYIIHHINGNKSDNRLENLQLLTRSEHAQLHAKFMTDITRNKISNKLTGIKRSDETRKRMSQAQRLNPSRGMLGKHHTEESKRKSSESNKKAWANKTEEDMAVFRDKISKSKKGTTAPNKGIPCPEHQKEFLSKYWTEQYNNGYISPSLGRIFITNGINNKTIYPEDLAIYEKLGYYKGFTRRKKINDQ